VLHTFESELAEMEAAAALLAEEEARAGRLRHAAAGLDGRLGTVGF
jgi:N-acetylmuramic acid 6-phosphate (MurNAc-6-P) etherase